MGGQEFIEHFEGLRLASETKSVETFVEKPQALAALQADIAAGRVKSTDLAASYYERIEAKNPRLNIYLSLTRERALEQASRIDAMAAKGDPLPALAGIPVGIKDVLVVKGAPSTAGSKILEGYQPPYDATAVSKLEAAGAVLLGKLNCDEFAMGSSNENSAYGPVRNPVDTERVPGGSSGGSAAAVAANLAVATLGTDTGGSIRQPASFCGVVGVLPTYGRVSRYGLIAFASSLDRVGPFAANVRDAATLLGIVAGQDPMDATSSPAPVPDFAAESDKDPKGLRIGLPEEYFAEGLDPEVRAAIDKGIEALEKAGCRIKKISLPHTKYAIPTYYLVATAEASANLARFDGVRYGYRSPASNTLVRHVQPFARRSLRGRGKAAHYARDVRAFGWLLRGLLFEGATGAATAGRGVSACLCRCRCDCHADRANGCIQAWRKDGRSAGHVPGRYLYGDGEPGGHLRCNGAVGNNIVRTAGGHAGSGCTSQRGHGLSCGSRGGGSPVIGAREMSKSLRDHGMQIVLATLTWRQCSLYSGAGGSAQGAYVVVWARQARALLEGRRSGWSGSR